MAKHYVVRRTVTADYFEVDCKTDDVAKNRAFHGLGSLVSTRTSREWVVVPEIPPEPEKEVQDEAQDEEEG